jgi:hypothetical protein
MILQTRADGAARLQTCINEVCHLAENIPWTNIPWTNIPSSWNNPQTIAAASEWR